MHQVARGCAQVRQIRPILGRDDKAELVAVVAAPIEEGAAVRCIALGRIDLPFLTSAGHTVTLDITQMSVHRLGADERPAARHSALRVELHDAGLHRYPPRPRARPAPVPAPRAPIPERQRRCGASAARIEPATSFAGVQSPVRVSACPPDRLMDFTDKAGRTPTRCPDSARACPCVTTVSDLARTDTELVFVVHHETTIGSRKRRPQEQKCSRRRGAWKHLRQRRCGGLSFPTYRGRRLSVH